MNIIKYGLVMMVITSIGLATAGCKESAEIKAVEPTPEVVEITEVDDLVEETEDLVIEESSVALELEALYFTFDGLERSYYLYLPENLPENAPLVFVLHGYTNLALDAMNSFQMNAVADENGFAICYPQGSLEASGKPYWNAHLNIGDVDDVGFLSALAKNLQETYHFSPEKTFASGMSNGGFMCYTLALGASDTFKAVASVVGTMSGADWNNRESGVPISILQISALDDPLVANIGMFPDSNGWGGAPSHEEISTFWVGFNGCDISETINLSEKVTGYRHLNTTTDIAVWYYTLEVLGHRWPQESEGLDASKLVWEFFNRIQ